MGLFKNSITFLSGFRKFSFAVLVLLVGVNLRVLDYLTGQEFVDLVQPVSVAFMGANVFERGFLLIRDWLDHRKGSSSEDNRDIPNEQRGSRGD